MFVLLAKYYADNQIKKMRLAGDLSCLGKGEVHTGFWWGNLRGRDHLGDPGIDGKIILNWIFGNWDGGAWTGLIWLRIWTSGRLL